MSKPPQRTLNSFANVKLYHVNRRPPGKYGWRTWHWPLIGIALGLAGFWAGVVWLVMWLGESTN